MESSSQEQQQAKQRKRRNSDCISNYVDRVRICDTKSVTSESVYSKASSQKSGWRQKSYSSIDLSTSCDNQPGAGAFRYRDFEAQDDLCIKHFKSRKNKESSFGDYEDIYNINPKAQGLKGEIIKEHNKIHLEQRENEVCSLRRTKSLAVIREETYNDLSIPAPHSRRSQLIPRAKLIDKHFFKDRLSFTLDEGLSFSLDSNLTSESTKNSNSNSNSNFFSWNCDKSDLGSIDSNFFKNSLHQNALSAEAKSNTLLTETTSVSTTATSKIVSRAEIHNENDTSISNNNGTLKLNERKSENNNNNENESTVNINEDTESGITIIEIKDRKQLSKPASSVISYDSIYLSSESDRQTVLGETSSNFEDIDSKIKDFEKIIRELNLIGDIEKSDSIIDNLYSQVAKGAVSSTTELDLSSAFIDANLDGLNKYNDYISKGTLDRLKILSGLAIKESSSLEEEEGGGCNKGEEGNKSKDNKTFQYQYASLPDVDISKLLRDCELIDAKLRDDVSIELLEPYPDYDLNSSEIHYATTTSNNNSNLNSLGSIYKVSQTKQIVTNKTTEPLSLEAEEEEENPKGAPSIELVQLPTKEVNNGNTKSGEEIIKQKPQTQKENSQTTTKIYLPDLGLELDYENSIVSAEEESNEEEEEEFHSSAQQQQNKHQELRHYQPPSFNLVTISGRKVIVDELAAKTEQQRVDGNNSKDTANSKAQKHIDNNGTKATAVLTKRKEGKSITSTSKVFPSAKSSTDKVATKKHINEKINGSDNRQTNIDKRGEESKQAKKINLPEYKQSLADSASDKKIIFRKNSNNRELEEVAIQLSFEKVNGNTVGGGNGKKDYTSFCILQTNGGGGSVNSSNNNNHSKKMPRPQLLNIIDSKNSAPKHNQVTPKNNKLPDVRIVMTTDVVDGEKPLMLNEAEKEFQHKVDSVRNYWSKILDSDSCSDETKASTLKKLSKAFSASKSSNDIPSSLRNEDFQSFFPSVEIVELNGETQTALVTSRKLNDEEFDHVRYKVMRSEMFQKNLASNNNRKETQFDGLMQYLQDYSFQELLANNNVVIIEPVRTKIEKISDKPNKAQSGACKITNGAAAPLNRSGSNNLKKHFFYHPIRVNKELYEDELPTPDTVRNVRKLFEESLRMGCGKKICEKSKMFKSSDNLKQKKTIRYLTIDTSYDNNLATSKWDSISLSSGVSSAADLNSPCECHDSNNNSNSNRNACTTSSNGSKENLDSHETDNSIDKSNFVGSDVLEKLRECGSSVTFYGDRKGGEGGISHLTANENDRNESEYTTKAIMKEVQKCNNSVRQSRGLSSSAYHNGGGGNCEKISTKKINASDYTGIKFKLVKSNSCSSRLELAGTDHGGSAAAARNMVENEIKNLVNGQREHFDEEEADEKEKEDERKEARKFKHDGKISKADLEQEETVKDMIYKLETKKYSQAATAAVAPAKPRIIESRCIEKVHPTSTTTRVMNERQESEKIKLPFTHEKSPIESLIPLEQTNDCEEYVTINNHISIANKHPEQNNNATTMMNEHIENGENGKVAAAAAKPKIVRNKNVDLALLAAVSKKKEVGKVHRGLKRDDSEHKFAPNDCKNDEHENTFIKTSHNNEINNIFNIQQQHQDKANSLHFNNKSFHFENDEHFAVIKAPPLQSSMATNRAEDKPVKMVNWGTVGTYCKEYIANDNRLVHQQIKTLEEMEFEEFEVAGEHYDSLNSK